MYFLFVFSPCILSANWFCLKSLGIYFLLANILMFRIRNLYQTLLNFFYILKGLIILVFGFLFFFWSCSILRRNTQSAFRYQVRRSTLVLCNYPKAWMTTLGLFGMYYCNKVFHWCFAIMYSVYRCNKHSQAS